jgi:hypothetical protein
MGAHLAKKAVSYHLGKLVLVAAGLGLNPGERNFYDNEETLMHVENQVFQICVHAVQSVDRTLFLCQHMVELYDSHRNRHVLLAPGNELLQ